MTGITNNGAEGPQKRWAVYGWADGSLTEIDPPTRRSAMETAASFGEGYTAETMYDCTRLMLAHSLGQKHAVAELRKVADLYVAEPAAEQYSEPVPIILLDPDCLAGKHRSCHGEGWDQTNDRLTGCPCECHETGVTE